ncbi:hypothetical protein BDL97_19G071900 [Sphagnum fallax]|nr:hypothetical protein BDL97_19G071900 [Sphagnum fallax]
MELASGAVSLPTAITEGFTCRRHLETGPAQGPRQSSRHISCSAYHAPSRAGEERHLSRRVIMPCGQKPFLWEVRRPSCHTCTGDQKSFSRRRNLRWKIEARAALAEEAGATGSKDAPSASSQNYHHSVQEAETLTSIAKKYGTKVETIAALNNITDVDMIQTGQELVIPAPSQGFTKESALSKDFINLPSPSRMQHETSPFASYRNKSMSSVAPATSGYRAFQAPTLVKLALPLMLIAPVLGFCVRCVVDYIRVHINEEVERRYAEMETYQTRHQPKVKRWQNILDGDRNDSPELVGVGAFMTVDEVRPVTNWQNQGGHVRNSTTEEALEKETEEEQDLRQQQDFEQIQKSYAELESTYTKFLSDSGLSRGGYWRSGVHQLQEDV